MMKNDRVSNFIDELYLDNNTYVGSVESRNDRVSNFIDELYLDNNTYVGSVESRQEVITKAIVKVTVNLCASWWSIKEVYGYINTKRNIRKIS